MVTTRTSPKRLVRALLADAWEPVRGLRPTFATGWYNNQRRLPFCSITNTDEVPGVKALTPSGAAHLRDGSVLLAVWVDSTVIADGKKGEAIARSLVEELWDECDRIITDNQQSDDVLNAGLEWIELGPSTEIVDATSAPVLYRLQGRVTYAWWHAP